jgi:hypothetical protein
MRSYSDAYCAADQDEDSYTGAYQHEDSGPGSDRRRNEYCRVYTDGLHDPP